MVEVRIPMALLRRLDNDVHAGIRVLESLKEAGVPVQGALWPRDVETGSLSYTVDMIFDEQVWQWTP